MAKEEQDKEQENGSEEVKEKPFGKLGLIILIAVNVFWVVVFAVTVFFISKPPAEIMEAMPDRSVLNEKDLNAPRIPIEALTVTVPTNEYGTEFRYLLVNFELQVGRLPSEYVEGFDLSGALQEENYLDTANKLEPYVRDIGQGILRSYTYLELQDPNTQEVFKQRLIDEINRKLKMYNLNPRITDVLITQFTFSN